MNRHSWGGLGLCIIALSVVPLAAATHSSRIDEPWPVLLSSEPAEVGPEFAALQQRANAALNRLVSSADASP